MEFENCNSFYIQPFKWEEDVERSFGDKSQVIHCYAMTIPAKEDGTPLCNETTTTCLFRIKNYPSRVSLILPSEYVIRGKSYPVTEKEVREIKSYFMTWVTSYHGMNCLDRESYRNMKHHKESLEGFFEEVYGDEYTPTNITWEKRRRVYYYKRASDQPLPENGGLNRYPEKEEFVMNVDFVNKSAAQKFSGSAQGCFMSEEYIDGKRSKSFVKQIFGKLYNFEIGFRGIDSVQKLLTERKVPRCGWFFVRDVELVKPAQRITNKGNSKSWITEQGKAMEVSNHTPEFFIESVSIFKAEGSVTRKLQSIPGTISWDIECYSDNHKGFPVAWNPKHAAYIITAVYQRYKRPETRIRKAFVYSRCDYTTPTEADGKTSCLVKCDTEIEMINAFSEFVQEMNPEILIGYNIFGFDINYLKIRLERQMKSWNNMGRLKENITQTGFTDWSSSAYGKNQLYWIEAPGRICVDMMKIIERDYKFSDYKLETVSQTLLNKGKNDVSPQEMFRIYETCLNNEPGCDQEMLRVVLYGIQDAVLPIELFEKINGWPFFIESSNVMCVNPMDLFTRGQQLRLLNQFYDKCFYMGFVIDARQVNIIEAEGAYVVPPKKGRHENMMTLDFASLYPSIMIAHNIGQDTLVIDESIPDEHCHVFRWTDEDEEKLKKEGGFEGDEPEDEILLEGSNNKDENDDEGEKSGKPKYKIQKNKNGEWHFRFIKVEHGHRSVAATMLVDLLGARKAVRAEQKTVKDSDPTYWAILEQRQLAIKVSCNSVYGMLLAQATGKLPLAEGGVCVTYRGRQLNLEMQRLARERYGAETIYGDSVTGDTPVLVRDPINGMRYENIEDLGLDWEEGYHGTKEFSKVVDGLEVWSDQGFTKVENLIRHKCNKKIIRVLTHSGCVDVTEDHSLLDSSGEKISPKDVVVGTELLHMDLPNIQEENVNLTEDGSYALGLFLAEGSCGSYDCPSGLKYSWAISNADVSVFDRAIKGLTEMHEMCSFKVLDTLKSSGAFKLVATCNGEKGPIRDLTEEYRKMFYDSRSQKKIPSIIFRSSYSIRKAFWDGYYVGDGDQDKNGYVRCDCKGKLGSAGLALLASSLGYPVSINTRTDKPTIFRMTCSRTSQRKDPTIVKKIIDLGYTEDYVYDFTTANHHFSAGIGRLVVHNTDSIMVKTAYTRLMVETAKKFGETRPSIEEIDRLAGELGIKDYSTEVAGRFLEHYHGFKEEYEVCNEMGEHIARDISGHLPKPISLEFENVFIVALFLMKKRYACIVLDRAKMVVKMDPKKMYTKGIMLARRDNCQWARDLFRDALYNILRGLTRQEVAQIVNEHIQRLISWQVSMKDLEIIQKLGFDYKSETFPLKLFSEHLQDIGKPAKPNDRIPFVVSSRANRLANPDDPKLGHFYRLSETLREEISRGENSIDYLYYIERLKNDVDQIFSIGYIPQIEAANRKRRDMETSKIDRRILDVEERIKGTQETVERLEARIEKSTAKEAVQLRKELRTERKKLTDFNKEHEKILKSKTLLETKGVEVFHKKTNTSGGLFLDDGFYEHVFDHLVRRKALLERIKVGEFNLIPMRKSETEVETKEPQNQTKTSPTAKSSTRKITEWFK